MEKILIRNGHVIDPANAIDGVCDILIEDGKIAAVQPNLQAVEFDRVIDAAGKVVAPGFIDMHCHLRDPGLEYKEDLITGTKSAARGGFTGVCCMPNTSPVNDNASVTRYILEKAQWQGSGVHVYPVGAISKGLEGKEMAEIGRMKKAGIVAISDDGKPVTNSNLLRLAMQYADYFGVFIMSHSEDKNLVGDGVMNEGYMSTKLGLPGITRAAEEVMIARDILVAEVEKKHLHLCHVSTKGGVQLIREAKARGVKITAETAPHYIGATDAWCAGYDSNCRVNPPLREEEDRLACIRGLCDGTLDAIATDHAPHHEDEKRVEFHIAASGIVGFETAFAISNTELVKKGYMSLSELVKVMSANPAKILGVEGGSLAAGCPADLVILDPEREITVDANAFASKGRNTPYNGKNYFGAVCATMVGGRVIYEE